MFGSTNIEIAIGIIVVFIIVSTICTAIREGIESVLKTRAAYLEQGIRQLLHDQDGKGLAGNLYNHPLVFGLFTGKYTPGDDKETTSVFAKGKNLPSYIPSKNFAKALMDIAASGADYDTTGAGKPTPQLSLDSIRQNVSKIQNPRIERVLLNAVDMAQGDLNKAQANIETWFNSSMDRVSGWYKRSTQVIIFVIAMFVAVGMNVNTLTIINHLAKSETARKMMVSQAEALNDAGTLSYEQAQTQLDDSDLPVGWPIKGGFNGGLILGWLITAFAATLGAPYWFDLLNKVMVIRSTVKPHEKSLEEGSQDAQPATPKVLNITNNETAPPVIVNENHDYNDDDHDDDHDGCDIEFTDITPDEELPEAKGGVVS